jgi:hypothetical protein
MINEIEFQKASMTFQVFRARLDPATGVDPRASVVPMRLFELILGEDQFNVDTEETGFHDCEGTEEMVRGFVSAVVPFEVERLVEGMMTKTLAKRIDTCEFIVLPNVLIAWGKPGPMKTMAMSISCLTGQGVSPMQFDHTSLAQFANRLTVIKSIAVKNPKGEEAQRVTMAGNIEDYEQYSPAVAPRHGIEKVAGVFDFSAMGPTKVSASSKGVISIGLKPGRIVTTDDLTELIYMIAGGAPQPMQLVNPVLAACRKLCPEPGSGLDSVTFSGPGMKTVTLTAETGKAFDAAMKGGA